MEDVANGRITITEAMTPLLIETATVVQVPARSETHRIIVYISKHGVKSETWLKFTDNTLISMVTPYYIMCNREIVLPAMVQ